MKTLKHSFVQSLHRLATGQNTRTILSAIKALGIMEAQDARTIELLTHCLTDHDSDMRLEAVIAFEQLFETGANSDDEFADRFRPASRALIKIMQSDPDGEIRVEATRALGKLACRETLPALIHCLENEGYPDVGTIDADDPSACWEVQAQALEALGHFKDPGIASALRAFLDHGDNEHLTATGFRIMGTVPGREVADFLAEKALAGDNLTRCRALDALDEGALETIEICLTDTEPAIRIAAIKALSKIPERTALGRAASLLDDPNEGVCIAALSSIAGNANPLAHDYLSVMVKDPRWMVRRAAVQALAICNDPKAEEMLSSLLETEDDASLPEILTALASATSPDTVENIRTILHDQKHSDETLISAAWCLGELLLKSEDPLDTHNIISTLMQSSLEPNLLVAKASLTSLMKGAPAMGLLRIGALLQPLATVDTVAETQVTNPVEAATQTNRRDFPSSTLAAIMSHPAPGPGKPRNNTAQERQNQCDDELRLHALDLLREPRHASQVLHSSLINIAQSGIAGTRLAALGALSRTGSEDAQPLLIEALGASDPDVCSAAAAILCQQDGINTNSEVLTLLMSCPDAHTRRQAIETLRCGTAPTRTELILKGLRDLDRSVCRATLGIIRTQDACQVINGSILDLAVRFNGDLTSDIGSALARLKDHKTLGQLTNELVSTEQEGQSDRPYVIIDVLCAALAV